MQKIYENTCLELVRELSKDLVKDVPTADSFTSVNGLGNAVEEINFTDATQTLMSKYHNPYMHRNKDGSFRAWAMFRDFFDITKVGDANLSINQAKEMLAGIYKESKDSLYGVLLMDAKRGKKKQIVNLLHPVVVHNLNQEELDFKLDEQIWTMAIYSFKDNKKDVLKADFPQIYDKENYTLEIANILASIDIPSLYYTENKDFEVDIIDDMFVLKYQEIKTLKESGEVLKDSKGGRSYIVPCQVINVGGVAFPYYGSIYSTKGLAWNITPLMSANISHPEGQSTNKGMNGGSRICTHSGNSKTRAGVSSLNHCNITSPLNSDCMAPGSMSYSEACITASVELLLGEEFESAANKADKALTFQEFVETNDGASKKQYLKYIKDRIAHKMNEAEAPEPEEVPMEERFPEVYDTSKWTNYDENQLRGYLNGDVTYVGDFEEPKIWIDSVWRNLNSKKALEWLENREENERIEVDNPVPPVPNVLTTNSPTELAEMTEEDFQDAIDGLIGDADAEPTQPDGER